MASNKSRIEVEIVADDKASDEIKQVAKEAKKLDGESVDVEIDADVSEVLAAFDDVAAEAKQAAEAAQVLGRALGPELAAKADTGAIVSDLKRMGLTIEQITGNADKLGAKLKNLSDADVGGRLGSTLGTARGRLDDFGRSAGSSKAVLANMVGNSVQDLGQLGGVAGSAGVAIGQMGENMIDAVASGEGLASVLGSFGTVALPMAAIGIGTALISDHLQDIAATKAWNKKEVEDYAAAIRDGESALQHFKTTVEETGKIEFIDDGDTKDAADAVDDLGLTVKDFQHLLHSDKALEEFSAKFDGARASVSEYDRETANAQQHTKLSGKEYMDLVEILGDVDFVMQAVTNKRKNIADAEEREERRLHLLGRATKETERETRRLVPAIDTAAHAIDDTAEAAERAEEVMPNLALSVAGVTDEMGNLADSIDEMEADALKKAFDVGNAPLDALTDVQNLNQAVRDLDDWFHEPQTKVNRLEQDLAAAKAGLEGLSTKETAQQLSKIQEIEQDLIDARKNVTGIPDIFDPNDVNADDFLNQFAQLRGPFQDRIAAVFADSGEAAAKATAKGYIDTIAEGLGMRPEDVARLLGYDDFVLQIKAEVQVDQARSQLALLEGLLETLPGGIPTKEKTFLANIKLALDAKTITGEDALTLIQPRLREFGVVIPTELAVPDSEKAVADAQAKVNSQPPVLIPTRYMDPETARETRRLGGAGTSVINNIYPSGVTPPAVAAATNIQVSRNGDRVSP